ncbi:MAG: site-2 protease family protein [Candidatus Aenigmarchaeota archaeon]|nr:site-2 protease family protein [Candidatus Aenigmarchaeota archaeon]
METFTKEEIRDIIISIIALVVVFAWRGPFPNFGVDVNLIPYYVIVVITAFLLHELAHKFVANKFGMVALYKMWPQGILFGLIFMLFGLRLVAPGAVVIHPYKFGRWGFRRPRPEVATNEMGLIAVSGPAVNLLLAIVFSLFNGSLFHYLTAINAWLGFFNLIPIPPLDGSKVLLWKPWVWGFLALLAILLLILSGV